MTHLWSSPNKICGFHSQHFPSVRSVAAPVPLAYSGKLILHLEDLFARMFLPKLLALFSMFNDKVHVGLNNGTDNKVVDMSATCTRVRAGRISFSPARASFEVISHPGYGVTQPPRGRCSLQLEVNLADELSPCKIKYISLHLDGYLHFDGFPVFNFQCKVQEKRAKFREDRAWKVRRRICLIITR